MSFGFEECGAVVAYGMFVFFTMKRANPKAMKEDQFYHWMLRGLLKLVMNVLLVITLFYLTFNSPADSWQLIVGYAALVIYILLDKVLCMTKAKPAYFWVVLLFMLGAAVVTYVAMLLDQTGLYLVPVGTFSGALAVRVILVIMHWYKGQTNPRQQKPKEEEMEEPPKYYEASSDEGESADEGGAMVLPQYVPPPEMEDEEGPPPPPPRILPAGGRVRAAVQGKIVHRIGVVPQGK